jgi:ribosomal protein S18 acetylase RimI-like enzyme
LPVDTSLQGKGIGGRLVEFVIGLAVQHVMPHTGCRFLVVDSKPQSIGFYESKGFKRIGEAETAEAHYTTMFIDLHHVKE